MEKFNSVCKNPWCKAHFEYTLNDYEKVGDEIKEPTQCKKCKSFSTELSGGVEWKDKKYEGVVDSGYHQIRYKITNYK